MWIASPCANAISRPSAAIATALRAAAHEVDLDLALVLAPARAVRERIRAEAPAELAVDAREQVAREARGDALRVVVGAPPAIARALRRSTPSSRRSLAASARRTRRRKPAASLRSKLPTFEPSQATSFGPGARPAQQAHALVVLARDRVDLEARIAREQAPRARRERAARDVDRHVAQAAVTREEGLDQQPRLARAAAAELGERGRLVEARGDRAGARARGSRARRASGSTRAARRSPRRARAARIVEEATGQALLGQREPRRHGAREIRRLRARRASR